MAQSNSLVELDCSYDCRFIPHLPDKAEEIKANITSYYIANLFSDSIERQKRYLAQDLEEWFIMVFSGALDSRLQITCIWYEYFFFFDDVIEKLDGEKAKACITRVLGILNDIQEPDPTNRLEVVLKDITLMLMSIGDEADRILARNVLSAIQEYCAAMGNYKKRKDSMDSFETYQQYRLLEAAAWPAFALVAWSYGIYLPPHMSTDPDVRELGRLAGLHACFVNDLYSYRVEALHTQYKDSEDATFLYNSIPVIMKEQRTDAQGAMDYLKVYISHMEEKFLQTSNKLRERYIGEELGMTNRLVEGYERLLAANWIWSVYCGRYNSFV
ncbi:hypothetical protein D9756_009297 [Leucocoprinus leucothites]|uniref:Terpene synthase n=1 Tax=Leucocoprinus leucothites TaxID=201217 RepID=A0A8H5CY11_9AGAR|nr:hypothetical protein D9756_009297 [Leucoagaricus leucothites]